MNIKKYKYLKEDSNFAAANTDEKAKANYNKARLIANEILNGRQLKQQDSEWIKDYVKNLGHDLFGADNSYIQNNEKNGTSKVKAILQKYVTGLERDQKTKADAEAKQQAAADEIARNKSLATKERINIFRFSLLYGDNTFITDRIRSFNDIKFIADSLNLTSGIDMTASANTIKTNLLNDIEKLTDQDIKSKEKRKAIEKRIQNFKDENIKNEVFKAYNKRRKELKFKEVDDNFKEINK